MIEAVSIVRFVTLSEVEMWAAMIELAFDSAQADTRAINETA